MDQCFVDDEKVRQRRCRLRDRHTTHKYIIQHTACNVHALHRSITVTRRCGAAAVTPCNGFDCSAQHTTCNGYHPDADLLRTSLSRWFQAPCRAALRCTGLTVLLGAASAAAAPGGGSRQVQVEEGGEYSAVPTHARRAVPSGTVRQQCGTPPLPCGSVGAFPILPSPQRMAHASQPPPHVRVRTQPSTGDRRRFRLSRWLIGALL